MASTFDGVLADFCSAYQALCVQVTGKDLFEPGDAENAPCWNWPEFRGYTSEEVSAVWAAIKANPRFWLDLAPLDGAELLASLDVIADLETRHDIYFVTSRVGERVKWQSERWLQQHVGALAPTVLISSEKGLCAQALKLDAYIDDNYDNIASVCRESGSTRAYLLDRRYNAPQGKAMEPWTRVKTVGQMLDYEVLGL